jgi:pimeloyl-ACP methyl ester carboxylesterase
LFIRIIDGACRLILPVLGFNRKIEKGLPFYMRSGPSRDPAIVFFHGLGIGLTAYIPFVLALAVHYPDRNIVLFEMPSIQMKLDENHVLPAEFATHVAYCLKSLKLDRNIVAGHSLGTACVRWMDLFYPELVHSRIFVDPIVFNLWEYHIAHHALYRDPKTFHERFLKYIAMAEPGHATFLHRYFVWFQNTYFTAELPQNSYVFLSENDNIVESTNVADYLVSNPDSTRRIVMIKAFRHGQILASPEVSRVVGAIQKLSKLP